MATFIEGVKSALRFAPCIALGNAEWAYGAAGRIFPFGPAEEGVAVVRALRRFIGCNPDNDPEEPSPEFDGGQCDGQLYIGTAQYENQNGIVPVSWKAFGPIGGFVLGSSGGTPGAGLISRGSLVSSSQSFTCAGGNPTLLPSPIYEQFVSSSQIISASLTSIFPCGNDDCGDIPPVLPPPTNINIDIDVTFNNEEGDEINVTIPFIFAPINVDINGRFNIPFTFEFGE